MRERVVKSQEGALKLREGKCRAQYSAVKIRWAEKKIKTVTDNKMLVTN